MEVVVKHRIRGDGRIWVDRAESAVRKAEDGGYAVDAPDAWDRAWARYDSIGDRILIDLDEESVEVRFHEGQAHFTWKERPYHIASMISGVVHIDQSGRPVVDGQVTVSGVHLKTVEPELLPLIRPLAWGLALRSEAIARQDDFSATGVA